METSPHYFVFPLSLKGTHIPQLCGLVLRCNTPPTSVTQVLIPVPTDEEGLFQQPVILSFCGSAIHHLCVLPLSYQDHPLTLSLQTAPSRTSYDTPARTLMSISKSEQSLLICPLSLFHPKCTQVHWPQNIL